MGKRIRVLTKCGEETFYDFDQEVDTVEIIEEPKPKKGESVYTSGFGGWAATMNKGHYFEEDSMGYYDMKTPSGETIGHLRRANLKGETRLA